MWTQLLQGPILPLLGLILGMSIGLFYDVLRPVRRRCGTLPAALLDMLFCSVGLAAVFCLAMCSRDGSLGLWELTSALGGLLLYTHVLSERVYGFFEGCMVKVSAGLVRMATVIKKASVLTKNLFKKLR